MKPNYYEYLKLRHSWWRWPVAKFLKLLWMKLWSLVFTLWISLNLWYYGGLNQNIFKAVVNANVKPLVYSLNRSPLCGLVPKMTNIAWVVPILKSVDKKRYAQLLFGRIVFVITFINELFLSHPSVAEDNKSMTLLIKVTFNIMVSEAQLSWFRSYICGREQYVCVNVTHLKVIFII